METTIDECIRALKDSTMFHMSLGSKELFHSNFLHWISIINWNAFLDIMHGLADVEKFWWEEESTKDCNGKPYDPKYNNIKVFREHRNFDLSIYILDSKKAETKNSNNDVIADYDNTTEYTHGSRGIRMVQRWIPVLVLENKMKSLPYKGQLEEYTKKAFEEWRKGERLIKPHISRLKSDSDEETIVSDKWIQDHGINFVLLSLMDTKIDNDPIKLSLSYKNKGNKKLIFPFIWKHTTYSQLVKILDEIVNNDSFSSNKDLDQSVVKDYKDFLTAFCKLATNWIIKPDSSYRTQIFPWNIETANAEAKRKEIEKYKKLRIHDIHEKLLYNQLLQMLEGELYNREITYKRYNIKTFKEEINDKNNKGCRVFTNSNYAHGVGIVEAFFAISDQFKLLIQVQGDRYCHMVISNGIVSEGKGPDDKKTLCVNTEKIPSELKNGMLNNYISINNSSPIFPLNVQPASWGRYGNDNIYQFVEIPQNATIHDVINAMADDINTIKNWSKKI